MHGRFTTWSFAAAAAVCAIAGSAGAQPRVAPAPAPRIAAAAPARNAAPPDTKPVPQAPAGDYRLGAGDKLRIEVYKDPQASLDSVQIRPDGKITMTLIGDIEASGKTPVELRETITQALKEYMNNPVVTVIVIEATAATAYVVGEVYRPGAVPLQGNMTVLQALAVAGGLKDFANEKNIRILRKAPAGVQTIPFNYKNAIKGAGPTLFLRPGDTIVVPD
jgi:polysaccharide export outer membrane protein